VLEGAPRFYRGGNTRHIRNIRCAHDAATETLVRCLFARPFLPVVIAPPATAA
jgi:tricarballylate dehydrogenase